MYTHRGAYLNALADAPLAHHNSRGLPVDVADVPLQRLVPDLGGDRHGATHVCLRKVDPPLVWRLIDEEGITHLNGAPTVLVMLAADPAAKRSRDRYS